LLLNYIILHVLRVYCTYCSRQSTNYRINWQLSSCEFWDNPNCIHSIEFPKWSRMFLCIMEHHLLIKDFNCQYVRWFPVVPVVPVHPTVLYVNRDWMSTIHTVPGNIRIAGEIYNLTPGFFKDWKSDVKHLFPDWDWKPGDFEKKKFYNKTKT
jgi:hypothetical protein